jgi:hypothetical protein
MNPSHLFHIGYPKTGTTWLQRYYFPRREAGFAYIRDGKPAPLNGSPGRHIIEQPLFHYEPMAVRRVIDGLFAAEVGAGLKPVISLEQLCGNPASGGWHAKEYAWRLAASFPDAQIFMVVREQRTMIRSAYIQYLRGGGTMSLRDYMIARPDHHVPQPNLHYHRYDHLLQHYLELFPRNQVLCLPYELFRDRPSEFLAALDAFSGAKPSQILPVEQRENARQYMLQYPVWRFINPLVKRDSTNGRSRFAVPRLNYPTKIVLRNLGRLMPKAWDQAMLRFWERQIEEVTAGFYEESNCRLGELIGYDLRQFGWRVADGVAQPSAAQVATAAA